MRKKQRKSDQTAARALLEQAPCYHLATTDDEGRPVLRVLNGVVLGDWILFHGALIGEKASCLERLGVVSAHDLVASIPSSFIDKEKACPATTYYRSVQAEGVLQKVEDVAQKARMLQALMEKYQPEGGYTPFDGNLDFYHKDLRSVLVFGLEITAISGKESLGQDRPAERTRKVVSGLWQRGNVEDLRAISLILGQSPSARPDDWTVEHEGESYLLHVYQEPDLVRSHAELLMAEYWRADSQRSDIERAIASSVAWVGLCDPKGQLCAAGRATSDAAWFAYLMDVVVRPGKRCRGLGTALMRALLDHPQLRNVPTIRLGTMDAMEFYRRFGFVEGIPTETSFAATLMTRRVDSREAS